MEQENKITLTWQEKLETTEKNAIELLGECFRVGGLSFVQVADLEIGFDPLVAREAEKFAELMNWIDFVPDEGCIVTAIGLEELRRVLRLSSEESITIKGE